MDSPQVYSALQWFYVSILPNNDLLVRPPEWFGARPLDANPANGNPATPWYRHDEHMDSEHIHLQAVDEYHALRRAHAILKDKHRGSILSKLKVTITK